MLDCHIHIERGQYTIEWVNEFIKAAIEKGLDEIYLLEHCYRFREFVPMYDSVCANSEYVDSWFHNRAGVLKLDEFLMLIDKVRSGNNKIKIKFGLEVCYFKEHEDFVYNVTKGKGLDFLVGSVHFIDNFAFDHKPEFWKDVLVDEAYKRFFETSVDLVRCGIYDGIAHPDSIKLFGHKPSFSLFEQYNALAEELAKSNMYAEQNSGIYRRCENVSEPGMNMDMLKILKAKGVKILTASDAHKPDDVGAGIIDMEKLLDL